VFCTHIYIKASKYVAFKRGQAVPFLYPRMKPAGSNADINGDSFLPLIGVAQ